MANFDGVQVKIGNRDFVVPGLTLKQVRLLLERGSFEDVAKGAGSVEGLNAVVDFVFLALSRAYPDVTKDWVEENLEVSKTAEVVLAVFKASGFAKGESAPGEAKP